MLLLKLHPLPLKHTPSYENSVIFAGVALGCLAGMRLAHSSSSMVLPSEAGLMTSAHGLLRLARRLAVGVCSASLLQDSAGGGFAARKRASSAYQAERQAVQVVQVV